MFKHLVVTKIFIMCIFARSGNTVHFRCFLWLKHHGIFFLSDRVMVKMTDLLNGNSWLWDRGKFMNRRYLMQVENVRTFRLDESLTLPRPSPSYERESALSLKNSKEFMKYVVL